MDEVISKRNRQIQIIINSIRKAFGMDLVVSQKMLRDECMRNFFCSKYEAQSLIDDALDCIPHLTYKKGDELEILPRRLG